MPIPAESCPPGTTPDVCCDTLWLIGDRIRTVACDAVMCCVDPDCKTEMRSYMTMGTRIQDLIGDSLIVTMVRAEQAPTNSTDRGRSGPLPITRATYLMELRENGWPKAKVSGRNIEVPDPAEVHPASAHSYSHAEKMWDAVLNGAASFTSADALFPVSKNPHIMQNGVSVGPLLPVGPQTYQAAWTVEIVVDARLRKSTP